MSLVLEHVAHAFGDRVVLQDVSLGVGAGEIVCLLGPSGCGKTTLLRIAAGLERLQAGRILIGGRVVAGPDVHVPPEERGVGLLFQDYALFPHLNVRENVLFGLTRLAPSERAERMTQALAQAGLAGYEEAYPHTLSGGQQQRVALARALAPRPRLLLLDEPFSDLDSRLRDQVRDDTLHTLQRAGISTLMVTHDAEEAMFMGERIALLREDGRIAQSGRPADLYLSPASGFVASFLGEVNRLPGRVERGSVGTPFGPLAAPDLPEGTRVEVLIRPEALLLERWADDADAPEGRGRARVTAARMLGRTSMVHLSVPGPNGATLHIHARVPGQFLPKEDEVVAVTLDSTRTFVFRAESAA
ncbi:MAG: ABC transporter ATP-binding protein [Proteobacteria bacterium]|nr:ABC transporter ATP-binding protein [Pseudomonadota bacterium]